MPALEIFGASIVAVGSFNPPIMSVDWFDSNKLVGSGDADSARSRDDYIVSRQVSRFQTDVATVQTLANQFAIANVGPVSPALADLAASVFELLPHTPVTAVGLNFMAHYKVSNAAEYHHFGDVLAPKRIWREIFPEKAVGMADLTVLVEQGPRDAADVPRLDNRRISVQPSLKVRPGLFLQINNHFGASVDGTPLSNAKSAASIVQSNWLSCYSESQGLFDRIVKSALDSKADET
jgi:hypothetical protein